MKFKLKEVRPNPFRDTARYAINPDKIEILKASIGTTGFWDNVVARKTAAGAAEIAYGEHRRQALLELYGLDHEIELIIRDLDDPTMLRMMANENMQEWGASALVVQETVRAVVLAFAEGKIELVTPDRHTHPERMRYAPSFRFIGIDANIASREAMLAKAYNAQTVAAFLGDAWLKPDKNPKEKVKIALAALEALEETDGELSSEDFKGIGTKQAEVVMQHYRAERQKHIDPRNKETSAPAARKAAAKVAKRVISDIKSGASTREIQDALTKERTDIKSRKRNPDLLEGLRELQGKASRLYVFNTDNDREKFEEIIANREHLASQDIKTAVKELRMLSSRVTDLADRLEAAAKPSDLMGASSEPLRIINGGVKDA